MKAALLNARRLNFDGRLTFGAIEAVVDLTSHDRTDAHQVVERTRGCGALISKEIPLGRNLIEQLPAEVRLICEAGTGYDNIDVGAAKARGITVCNIPGYSSDAVAQLTLTLLLMLSTGAHRLLRSVAIGDRDDFFGALRRSPSEVAGRTLGVIGAGAIGERVIRLARALAMPVRVYSRSPRWWDDEGVTQADFGDVLAASDFVTLHCPLTTDTRHLIRTETLGRMKKGACLINTARGELVNHADLVEALGSGLLAGAALDVQDPEPPPDSSSLWTIPDVILTPHIGWKAIEARRRLIAILAETLRAFLDGSPINVVSA